MLRALLLAPPGAGEGTQGQRLAELYRVPHIATGDLLRQNVAEGTPLGDAARTYMEMGDLVPDDLVVDMIRDRVDGDDPLEGFVLDGFPRTLTQAAAAYEWGKAKERTFRAVISLDVAEDELVRRLLKRGHLDGRIDDTEETIRHRLAVYEEESAPLLGYYRDRGILLSVDGVGDIDDVTDRIVKCLAPVIAPPA